MPLQHATHLLPLGVGGVLLHAGDIEVDVHLLVQEQEHHGFEAAHSEAPCRTVGALRGAEEGFQGLLQTARSLDEVEIGRAHV